MGEFPSCIEPNNSSTLRFACMLLLARRSKVYFVISLLFPGPFLCNERLCSLCAPPGYLHKEEVWLDEKGL